jgi:hypothetical protein
MAGVGSSARIYMGLSFDASSFFECTYLALVLDADGVGYTANI